MKSYTHYLKIKRQLEQRLNEVDQWLLENVSHPDWMTKAKERMNLLVKHDTVCTVISNIKSNRPTHGYSFEVPEQLKSIV